MIEIFSRQSSRKPNKHNQKSRTNSADPSSILNATQTVDGTPIAAALPENKNAFARSNNMVVTKQVVEEQKSDMPSSKVMPKQTRTSPKKKVVKTKAGSTATSTQNKTKSTQKRQQPRARGVLYGLSTLKRQDNVRVNAQADHTTVKSNFVLGPLVLKVEKPFGYGANRSLKSATATTNEMVGRINLRIVNGVATLHSIKVQQPKKVQVDSADNHDQTREFVWKKSSHIAQVVSQKLTAATKSILEPVPAKNSVV